MAKSTKLFVNKARLIHKNKYDYSYVVYNGAKSKVNILCKTHGLFVLTPNNHLSGRGCRQCGIIDKANIKKSEFIKKANTLHGNIYDYSLAKYHCRRTKISIACCEHGIFMQAPELHLRGSGCPKCGNIKKGATQSLSMEQFIEKARSIHKERYSYSLVEYINSKSKVSILCEMHGEFLQTPSNHLYGYGCKLCGDISKAISQRSSVKQFMDRAKIIHKNKYNYSKTIYTNSTTKVIIRCPNHGDFKQMPSSHLSGNGCRLCIESRGEKAVAEYLANKHIKFDREKRFPNCKDKRALPFDFYIPSLNICIEYDGKQHYTGWWQLDKDKMNTSLIGIQKRDAIKTLYCEDNGIKLIRIPYYEFKLIKERLAEGLKS